MTSTAIYIDPTGKPFVSFEPVPEEPICTCTPEFEDPDCHLRIEEYSRWKSALVEVEDQEKVKELIVVEPETKISPAALRLLMDNIKPDTIIPFVASWEVVRQRKEKRKKTWEDSNDPDWMVHQREQLSKGIFEYRQIARLVNQ